MHKQESIIQFDSLAQFEEHIVRFLRGLLSCFTFSNTTKPLLHIDLFSWYRTEKPSVVSAAVRYIYGAERSTGAVYVRSLVSVAQNLSLSLFAPNAYSYGVPKPVYDKELCKLHTIVLPPSYQMFFTAESSIRESAEIDLSQFLIRLPRKAKTIIERTDPEGLISKMFPFPVTKPGARYVAACFWSWLCVLDGKPYSCSHWLDSFSCDCGVASTVHSSQIADSN